MVGTKPCGVAKRALDFELEGAVLEFQVQELGEFGQPFSLSESRFTMSQTGGQEKLDQITSKSLKCLETKE